ncbi:MAG: hypothetical protein CVU39_02365 [Chloroflexi bacterium HGW-Chloroflexi-10]|jgi:hypothetical protein|nr:MAG: hypothetical protein CVU39_02365 [Chloroflexi bacterium HGW-Chloroflexi-10]
MAKIRCHYEDCGFLDEGFCSAALIEVDPDKGCITYVPSADSISEESWDNEDDEEVEEWSELSSLEEEDDDDWLEEDEEY